MTLTDLPHSTEASVRVCLCACLSPLLCSTAQQSTARTHALCHFSKGVTANTALHCTFRAPSCNGPRPLTFSLSDSDPPSPSRRRQLPSPPPVFDPSTDPFNSQRVGALVSILLLAFLFRLPTASPSSTSPGPTAYRRRLDPLAIASSSAGNHLAFALHVSFSCFHHHIKR